MRIPDLAPLNKVLCLCLCEMWLITIAKAVLEVEINLELIVKCFLKHYGTLDQHPLPWFFSPLLAETFFKTRKLFRPISAFSGFVFFEVEANLIRFLLSKLIKN